jgi:hypothetical protein
VPNRQATAAAASTRAARNSASSRADASHAKRGARPTPFAVRLNSPVFRHSPSNTPRAIACESAMLASDAPATSVSCASGQAMR